MFRDEFKERYTTIPFAIYREYSDREAKTLIAHQHKEAELIAITEGSADFYVDTRHYRIEKGDVLIIPPFSIHRAKISHCELVSYNCICFSLDLIWDNDIKEGLAHHTLSVTNVVKKEDDCARSLQEWIERGCRVCEEGGAGWEMEAIGCMSLVFGCLKRQGYFSSNLQIKNKIEFAQKTMNYITDHYGEPITSTSAASALYMNNSYFCRKFKQAFGGCFSDYLLIYRLEKAKIYLSTTSDPITEISFRVGFGSCSYFSKAFKEHFGITPLAYRKSVL